MRTFIPIGVLQCLKKDHNEQLSNKSQGKGGHGRGGRGNNSNNNKQNKKGKSFPSSGTSSSKDESIVAALKGFHFDCDQPGSADQAQKTLEKAIDYLGVTYSSEIRTELETRKKYVLNDPPYPAGDPGVIKAAEAKKKAQFQRMKVAWEAKIAEIQSDSTVAATADAQIAIAELENKIELAEEEANKPFVPKLSPEQQLSHSNECKINSQMRQKVKGHEGQAFTTLKSLCTDRLLYRMKQDPGWDALLLAADPLQLLDLIEKTVRLTSTDNYVFAVAYKQHKDFYNFQQNNLSNNLYYDKFNTRVTVAKAIGIQLGRPDENCLNWVIENVEPFKTAHTGTDYEDLDKDTRALVRDKAEELYLGYVMTIQSAAVNDKLKTDLHNNFTVGTNIYPGSPQASLHLLDKYLKQVAVQPVQPQGHSFAQGGRGSGQGRGRGRGRGRGDAKKDSNETEDPAKWAGLICSRCGGKDHIARVCTAPLPGKAAASSQERRQVHSFEQVQSFQRQQQLKQEKPN